MGHKSEKSTIKILTQIGEPVSSLNWMAIGLGGMTVVIICLFSKITKAVPSALVALLAATLTAYFMKLDVPLIGDIPSGFPSLKIGGELMLDPSITWITIGKSIQFIGGFPLDISLMSEMLSDMSLVRELPIDPFMIGSIVAQGISHSDNLLLNVPFVPSNIP